MLKANQHIKAICLGVAVELKMQVKKIRNENSVLLQEAIMPHYIRYIVAKD